MIFLYSLSLPFTSQSYTLFAYIGELLVIFCMKPPLPCGPGYHLWPPEASLALLVSGHVWSPSACLTRLPGKLGRRRCYLPRPPKLKVSKPALSHVVGCLEHQCPSPSLPVTAAPPADAPLHRFHNEEYLLEQITRGEALCTWTAHHCTEMRLALAELVACKKLAGLFEREESPRGKGKDRAEPQDNEGSPTGTEDEDEDAEGETFKSWGGI